MTKPAEKSRQAIREAAASWFVRLREGVPSRETRERFTAWVTESPVHVEEYLAIAELFGALQHVDSASDIDIDEIVEDETVISLPAQGASPSALSPSHGLGSEQASAAPVTKRLAPKQRRNWLNRPRSHGGDSKIWAAIAAVAIISVVVAFIVESRANTYATELGEQRVLRLDDGSMITLNTSSRIEVDYSLTARSVKLREGEALFDIAKDPERPFLVKTDAALIRVTGTRFNVRNQGEGTAITVLSGEVAVSPRSHTSGLNAVMDRLSRGDDMSQASSALLAKGRHAFIKSDSQEVEPITVENLESITAWTKRRLVFESVPLSEIAKEFNRYNRRQIVLENQNLAGEQVSGVFGYDDLDSFVLFLQRAFDVEIGSGRDGAEIRIRGSHSIKNDLNATEEAEQK